MESRLNVRSTGASDAEGGYGRCPTGLRDQVCRRSTSSFHLESVGLIHPRPSPIWASEWHYGTSEANLSDLSESFARMARKNSLPPHGRIELITAAGIGNL